MTVITNEEFGNRIGVSHSMASRIRNGRRLPGTQVLWAIHREFGIPVEELMAAHQDGPTAFGELISGRVDRVLVSQ